MNPRFKFHACEHALAGDARHDFLIAACIQASVNGKRLHFPAFEIGVTVIHAVEVRREQRGLLAAGAGANLEDGALFVGRVLRQELDLQRMFKLRHAQFKRLQLFAGKFPPFQAPRPGPGQFDEGYRAPAPRPAAP